MSDIDDIVGKLLTAPNQAARIKLLAKDTDFVFDFDKHIPTPPPGKGGYLVSANAGNFPALFTGNGAMTIGVLGPCGLNSPHTHPRATELQFVASGGPVQTAFIQENGVRTVQNVVKKGSATIFPKGSLHFQQNLACKTTTFVASFDFIDPGTLQAAQSFFALDKGVVSATLGGVECFDNLTLPENVVLGAQKCLDRCHIDRSSFNFSSTFADYIAFSNSTWAVGDGAQNLAALAEDGPVDIPFSQNPLRPAVLGLGAGCAALLLVLLAVITSRRRPARAGLGPIRLYYDDVETLVSQRRAEKF